MANPTQIVTSTLTSFMDECVVWPLSGSSLKTYQTGQMMGLRSDGYAADFDDSASLMFLGILEGAPVTVDSATDGVRNATIRRPKMFGMNLVDNSGSATTATKAGDIGAPVYAYEADKVTLAATGRTYANVVGTLVGVQKIVASPTDAFGNPASLTGKVALVAPSLSYGGPVTSSGYRGVRFITATTTLTLFDLNKIISIANSGTMTVNLPAVASVPDGSKFRFVKTSAAAAAITVDGNASEAIDGSTTHALMDAQYDTIEIVKLGSQWYILNSKIA